MLTIENKELLRKFLTTLKSRIGSLIMFVLTLIIGWTANYVYTNITFKPVVFKTDKTTSIAIDERGRLHVLDLEDLKTVIYSDTIALAIHSKISNDLYKDYVNKTGK